MTPGVSIVTPAYGAKDTIARAARSIIRQTHRHWEWIIVADDIVDYEAVLGKAGIVDQRIRFLATGATGSGSPKGRNIGIEAAQNRYSAILDADDYMHETKLARAMEHLPNHGIVSCALEIVSATGETKRLVGVGTDRVLRARDYKFTNLSMDSMLVYDRQRADPRFNPDYPCLTDIEFLLRLFAASPGCFHVGQPLHTYVKQPGSISNKPGASSTMLSTKKRLIADICSGNYLLADPEGIAGMLEFYDLSLKAERDFEVSLAAQPGLLFEDHLEGLINSTAKS